MKKIDSCKLLLATQNYSLVQLADHQSGNVYDVFRENLPIRKGWGTFIYNRRHAKRLFIHVTHPVDDGNVARIGAELFQKTRAEWLYIAGTQKSDNSQNDMLDAARTKESVFQRWHEMFTDLTHISLSLHGFEKKYYRSLVSTVDVVLSNGKTSDHQWGISRISLTFRDSLKNNGVDCAVAMYDSGFAALGWGVSPQGTFSNDSVGFGHWVNIELSRELRYSTREYSKFINLTDQAFEVTGQKVSEQVNRAFGLVSPRTLRVDAQHGLLFPPNSADSYRIVSFNSGSSTGDTINIRVGGWMRFPGSSQPMASVTGIDSLNEGILQHLRQTKRADMHSAIAKIVEKESPAVLSPYLHFQTGDTRDSISTEDGYPGGEPIQVHRIPLRQERGGVPSDIFATTLTPYVWEGGRGLSSLSYLQFDQDQTVRGEGESLPNFLIPIFNRSWNRSDNPLVGLRMTSRLAEQIAKLVAEHRDESHDVQLLAEMSDDGDYYLRVFPAATPK